MKSLNTRQWGSCADRYERVIDHSAYPSGEASLPTTKISYVAVSPSDETLTHYEHVQTGLYIIVNC